jgi:hypothetical protein
MPNPHKSISRLVAELDTMEGELRMLIASDAIQTGGNQKRIVKAETRCLQRHCKPLPGRPKARFRMKNCSASSLATSLHDRLAPGPL